MVKRGHKKNNLSSWFFLGVLVFISLYFSFYTSSSKPVPQIHTRATAANRTLTASGTGAVAIQSAIDSAKDDDTIVIPKGTYQDNTNTPLGLGDAIWVSASRGASSGCFIRIDGKRLTLKGESMRDSILHGEGHGSKADIEPYKQRAGICIVNNANVTIDNLRVKEFQKRAVVVYNSNVIVKNSIIEGCDEGGISLLGNSSGLFVNNFIVAFNFGGVMLWQNSQAKIINNIFHDAAVMFFYHPKTNDQAKAEIINNVFTGGHEMVKQVDWWPEKTYQLKANNNIFSYNLVYKPGYSCNPKLDYCDSFPGKIEADPLYIEPVADMGGIAPWGNFNFKEGSPAIGKGDSSIPGTKTLGNAGGPCVQPGSSTCVSFISQYAPKPPQPPTPTPKPTNLPPSIEPTHPPPPIVNSGNPNPSSSSQDVPIGGGPIQTGLLIIENIGFDTLKVNGIRLNNTYIPVNQDLSLGGALEYPLITTCTNSTNNMLGGVLYTDKQGILSFSSLAVFCGKNNVLDIY